MSITHVGTTTPVTTTGAATVSWPAGHVVNDVAFLIVASRDAQSVSTPSGWTSLAGLPVSHTDAGAGTGNGTTLSIFYKVAASSSEASVTLNDPGTYTIATISAYRGVDTSSPISAGPTVTELNSTTNASVGTIDTFSDSSTGYSVAALFVIARGEQGSGAAWASGNSVSNVGSGTTVIAAQDAFDGGASEGALIVAYDLTASNGGTNYTPSVTFNGSGNRSTSVAAHWTIKESSIPAASASATLGVTGTATGALLASSTGAASLGVTAVATGALIAALAGAASFGMTGGANGVAIDGNGGSANFGMSANAIGQAVGYMTGSASLGVSATANISSAKFGAGSASLGVTGAANGVASTTMSGTSEFGMTASAIGQAIARGTGSAAFTISGFAGNTALLPGSGTASLAVTGTANGLTPKRIWAAASASMTLTGVGIGRAVNNSTAATSYRNAWLTFYAARQALLDKLNAVHRTRIDINNANIVALNSAVAGKADATAVSLLQTRVTVIEGDYGVNLLINPGLALDAKGWGYAIWNEVGDPNWIVARDDLGTSYQVPATHNIGFHNTGTPVASKNYVQGGEFREAQAGTEYMLSGYIAAANVSVCDLRIYFYDSEFSYISEATASPTAAGKTGGTSLANWAYSYVKAVAPAGSRWMRIGLRAYTSGAASPRAHLMQAMVERAAPGQTVPSTFNTGSTAAWAEWNITFNVDGYISGVSLASDGRSTAFAVAADVFQVRSPSGSDALTWNAGVLSSRKGSKELKIGAGFGSDPDTKRLIFSYGNAVADASASRTTADIWIAENGENKLGGFQLNYGSAWKAGGTITYSAAAGTPATATISVTSGVLAIGSREYTYSASSAAVTGTNGTTTTFYLYYDDPGLLGGTRTLYASVNPLDTYNNDNKVVVGQVSVMFPATGSGSGGGTAPGGGGGRPCPEVNMWVIERNGPKRAGDVKVGDMLLLCCPDTQEECWGMVSYSKAFPAEGVQLDLVDGTMFQGSTSAPIPTPNGYVTADRMQGHVTLTKCDPIIEQTYVEKVTEIGLILVQHIHVGDRCFWTGSTPDAMILHHNIKMGDYEP